MTGQCAAELVMIQSTFKVRFFLAGGGNSKRRIAQSWGEQPTLYLEKM